MKLHIQRGKFVKDVKDAFTKQYPFLKIEFYRNSDKTKMLHDAERIYLNTGDAAMISIDATRSLRDVKNDIKELIGYTSQIFSRSGNVWIETSLTDDWTLDRQNKEGETLNVFFTKAAQPYNNNAAST